MLPFLPRPCFNVILASNTGEVRTSPNNFMPVSSDKLTVRSRPCLAFYRIKHNLWSPYVLKLSYGGVGGQTSSYHPQVGIPIRRSVSCDLALAVKGFSLYLSLQYKYYIIFSFIRQGESLIFNERYNTYIERKLYLSFI